MASKLYDEVKARWPSMTVMDLITYSGAIAGAWRVDGDIVYVRGVNIVITDTMWANKEVMRALDKVVYTMLESLFKRVSARYSDLGHVFYRSDSEVVLTNGEERYIITEEVLANEVLMAEIDGIVKKWDSNGK